jgi:hypothetical protein
MALAKYLALCIDATDPAVLSDFWGSVLGLEQHPREDGIVELTGRTERHALWVNPVPEAKTVKHRMHLDLNTASVEQLVALGATVLDADSFAWTLMADPEGGEFCAFVREGQITEPLYEIVVDTSQEPGHALRIATWWADVLGAHAVDDGDGDAHVESVPGAPFQYIVFGGVPEPKTGKNRLHLDLTTSDLDLLVGAGAVVLRAQDDEIGWTVLADPDGNEFDAFVDV